MGWSSQVVVANQVIIDGEGDYLLIYDGAPASGDLTGSIAAAAGDDSEDNAYLEGIAAYASEGGDYFAINMFASGLADAPIGLAVFTAGSPAGPYIRITIFNFGSTGFANGWVSSPVYGQQPGAAGVPDPWNYVGAGGQPAFDADWGNAGSGNAQLAFRMLASPANSVQITGVVTPSAGAGDSLFTLPAGYRPGSDQVITGNNRSTAAGCDWLVRSTGLVEITAAGGGVITGDTYDINGIISLDI